MFWQVATLLDLEVDLLFFDTTSTYFERDTADEPVARDERGGSRPNPTSPPPTPARPDGRARTRGAGGSARAARARAGRGGGPGGVPRLRQVQGSPRRPAADRDRDGGHPRRDPGAGVVLAGNTTDSALIRQVKADMRDWTLCKIVWVADRGFSSADNRRYLRRGDHHYIIGEKLRSGSAEATAALSRPGRYQQVARTCGSRA